MPQKFIEWIKLNNWNLEYNEDIKDLPQNILNRYSIDDNWLNFIKHFKLCENSNSTKWFLTVNDYFTVSNGFQWNEFELQSLEACGNIISFGNRLMYKIFVFASFSKSEKEVYFFVTFFVQAKKVKNIKERQIKIYLREFICNFN